MNTLILISPAPGSGFQPILSGKKADLSESECDRIDLGLAGN